MREQELPDSRFYDHFKFPSQGPHLAIVNLPDVRGAAIRGDRTSEKSKQQLKVVP